MKQMGVDNSDLLELTTRIVLGFYYPPPQINYKSIHLGWGGCWGIPAAAERPGELKAFNNSQFGIN